MTDKLNDLLPTTPDMQQERLEELKKLFPDMFDGEGRLKLDDIKQLTGDEPQCSERYDFSWYGKRNAKSKAYTPTTATLSYDESRSVNPDKADGNIIIEGENLESLKTLLAAYRESIKCIYIDPPYNTGKDFVYSDNYTEEKRAYWEETGGLENGVKIDTNPETAGRYHSNWLSMMYSRLILARQLLKDDGVIFVSIDDNEVHNLRRLMDEVFGEENFIANVIWHKRYAASNDAKGLPAMHDHILMYQKTSEFKRLLLPRTEKQNSLYKYDSNDGKGLWRPDNLTVKTISESYLYKITNPNTGEEYLPTQGRCWLSSEEKIKQWISEGRIFFGQSGKGAPQLKRYLNEVQNGVVPNTYWSYDEVGHTDKSRKELKEVFETSAPFDNPKPTDLLKRILQISMDKNDFILDFFGGSGTTAHAVASQNNEDAGNRKFILVQLPEQTPAKSEARKAGYNKISDITIERAKRVIEGYGENPTPIDTGFKVYQLTPSHFPRTEFKPDPEKSEVENIEALKQYIAEKEKQLTGLFEPTDIQDEVLLKNGFKLNYQLSPVPEFTANTIKLADDGEKQSLICLDKELKAETVDQLLKNPKTFICLETSQTTSHKWNLRQHLKHQFIAF